MKKKLSLNKLKITSMDANALRGVRGGDTFDNWSTYERTCTHETYHENCTQGYDCMLSQNNDCPDTMSPPDGPNPSCGFECSNADCTTYPENEGCSTFAIACTV